MDPFSVFLMVAGGAQIFRSLFQVSAADQRIAAIDTQAKEQEIQFQQKKMANIDTMQKLIARQTAQATTRGIALDSPSFNALQIDTLNTGAKNAANLEVESGFVEANRKAEHDSVKTSLFAQIFGDTVAAASSFAALKKEW